MFQLLVSMLEPQEPDELLGRFFALELRPRISSAIFKQWKQNYLKS